MPERSPSALVRACRRGEAEAWDEVLERYGRLIWSVALRLGTRDEEAEEVFQRTWVAVIEGIGTLKDPERLVSWIAGTARFQTFHLFSERRRQRRASSLEAMDGVEPGVEDGTHQDLEALEQSVALHAALSQMDERCRSLLELLFLADPPLDYQEIARRTGLAVGSIGPIRARCLKRLRALYSKLYQAGDGRDSCDGSDHAPP